MKVISGARERVQDWYGQVTAKADSRKDRSLLGQVADLALRGRQSVPLTERFQVRGVPKEVPDYLRYASLEVVVDQPRRDVTLAVVFRAEVQPPERVLDRGGRTRDVDGIAHEDGVYIPITGSEEPFGQFSNSFVSQLAKRLEGVNLRIAQVNAR